MRPGELLAVDASRQVDPVVAPVLARIGLTWSSDAEPGIRRRRAGRGWSYRHDDDGRVTEADDPDEQAAHLARHCRQLRQHVDALAAKAYWRALPCTPEFVVLFVPGESFLSAALEGDPSLLEYAADKQVVLATPTTLIALLRTVAYAWTQQTLADKAREIHTLGRDLHDRLATMSGHLDRLGRSLTGAVSAYNRAVGSLENRVLVSARRFHDLGVAGDGLDSPEPVVESPRPLTAAELLEVVAEPRPELPELDRPGEGSPPVRRVAP